MASEKSQPSQFPKKKGRNRGMKLIDDETSRKVSYKKRKSTLKNKALELATLCNVTVCVVCAGADGKVETWPGNKAQVQQIYNKVKEKVKSRISEDKLDLLFSDWDEKLNHFSEEALLGLYSSLESKLQRLREGKIHFYQ